MYLYFNLVCRGLTSVTAMKPYGVTREANDVKGQQLVSFVLGGRKFSHTFLVCPLPTETDGLFGRLPGKDWH